MKIERNPRNIKKADRPRDLDPDLGDEVVFGRVTARKRAHRRFEDRGVEQIYFNHPDLEFTKTVADAFGQTEVFVVMDRPERESQTFGAGWADLGWVADYEGDLYDREGVFSWGNVEPITMSFTATEPNPWDVIMLAVGLDPREAATNVDPLRSDVWIDGDIVVREPAANDGWTAVTWFRHDGAWLQANNATAGPLPDKEIDWLLEPERYGTYRVVKRSGTLQ